MSEPIRLIALRCTNCQTPIPAGLDEVAWACATCGQSLLLDEEKGAVPYPIQYAANIPANSTGKPFWVVEGRVRLERETYSGIGKKNKEAEEFWGQPRTFFIPAYTCSVDELVTAGTHLVLTPPALQEGSRIPFLPVTLKPDDLQALAEYVVVGVEAERKDKLKTLKVQISLGSPQLWILA